MKNIILTLGLLSCSNSWAQKIEVDHQTYAEYSLAKIKNMPANSQLISWGQAWLEENTLGGNFINELEDFEVSTIMNYEDRSFLIDLLEKLIEKADKHQKQKIQVILCKWTSLNSNNEITSKKCDQKSYSLQSFKDRNPEAEFLVAEDMGIQLNTQYSLRVYEQAVYNWKILSSTQKVISFRGTFADLNNQTFAKEKLITGDCESFTHSIDDLEIISRGSAYFLPDCRKSLNQPETSQARQWYEKNKSWVIPVGLVVLGAMAYKLKDKKIIIHKPR
jgi:hypothetical protein